MAVGCTATALRRPEPFLHASVFTDLFGSSSQVSTVAYPSTQRLGLWPLPSTIDRALSSSTSAIQRLGLRPPPPPHNFVARVPVGGDPPLSDGGGTQSGALLSE